MVEPSVPRLGKRMVLKVTFFFPVGGLAPERPGNLSASSESLPQAGGCGHCRSSMAGHCTLSPTCPWEGGAQAWRGESISTLMLSLVPRFFH